MSIGPPSKVNRPLPTSHVTGRVTTAGRSASTTRAPAGTRSTVGSGVRAGAAARSTSVTKPMADRTNSGIAKPGAAAGGAGKRAGWDLKGRLTDMEAQFAATVERVSTLENQNNQLKSNVEEKETIVVQNSEELKAIKDERDRLTEQVRSYHTNQSRREC